LPLFVLGVKGKAEMWKRLSVFLLLLAVPRINSQGTTQFDAEQARILTLENAWNQAEQQKDAGALKVLLGPEMVFVDHSGKLMERVEYLASVQSPSLHPARIVTESMKVHFYGVVAVVNGVYREAGVKSGKAYALRERFTDTWVRQGDNWVCVASQSTLILH
jgi:ketosteroid isomerase-like protein